MDVIIEKTHALGRIRLNRPKAINALTLPMIEAIAHALPNFAADPAIAAVLITGEGERGLCAGGDIRALYDSRANAGPHAEAFFRAEYRMNAAIKAYPKPYVAIMDGITMGGGVGVSAHGSVRIVTERTRMAMPETGIGFYPDVGGTWLLSQSPGEFGTYLGLTGDSFGGADAILAGFADHFVTSSQLPALIAALEAMPATATLQTVQALVKGFSESHEPPHTPYLPEIDRAFAHDRLEDIIAALQASNSDFAKKTLAVMAQKSPTSMKVTLKLLRLARGSQNLEACLEREFIATQRVVLSDEFYEGVRAAVVDKDRAPRWNPDKPEAVTDDLVNSYFTIDLPKLFP
ncbi:enoyl-CoA hydratase/isomerase family protein [Acidocella sp.]|uniref:enoyl-CoA hydratase/isomerase family protein n=1 Tax=Acidocella sp. TaxID=50710 RepID=UPI00260FF7DB|nr:enoyl-CoA hydratase/isomerase family protein [Acidocella sp.]